VDAILTFKGHLVLFILCIKSAPLFMSAYNVDLKCP
jgi:hypothetical protein